MKIIQETKPLALLFDVGSSLLEGERQEPELFGKGFAGL
jgi:hypothetical protein